MKAEPGDTIMVKVGDKEYETIIDEEGVQRFPSSPFLRCLFEECGLKLDKLNEAYRNGKFTQEEYLNFCLNIGYSVTGFSELDMFEDLEIENPLWD